MVHRPRGYAAERPLISRKTAHDKGDSAQRNRCAGRKNVLKLMYMCDIGAFRRRDQGPKVISAARMALRGSGEHFVSLDQVIKMMRDTGRDMQDKYK